MARERLTVVRDERLGKSVFDIYIPSAQDEVKLHLPPAAFNNISLISADGQVLRRISLGYDEADD